MKNILLLEDDENLNRGISLKLSREGYRVFSALTLTEARTIFNALIMQRFIRQEQSQAHLATL